MMKLATGWGTYVRLRAFVFVCFVCVFVFVFRGGWVGGWVGGQGWGGVLEFQKS